MNTCDTVESPEALLYFCYAGESIAVDLYKKRQARPFRFQIMILHRCCGMYCLRNACLVSCSYPAWRNIVCYSFKYAVIHRGGLQSKMAWISPAFLELHAGA